MSPQIARPMLKYDVLITTIIEEQQVCGSVVTGVFVDRNGFLPLTGQQIFSHFLVYSAFADLCLSSFAGFGRSEVRFV